MEPYNDIVATIERISGNGADVKEYECLVALLANMQPANLKTLFSCCDIVKLFSSMNLQERKYMEVAIRLAGMLFSAISLTELLKDHQTEILQALQSSRDDLIEFVLRKLNDGLRSLNDLHFLPHPILKCVIGLLSSDNCSISKAASNFLSTLACQVPGAINVLFSPDFVKTFRESSTSSEKTLRVIEMVVDIVKVHPSRFNDIKSTGILEPLLDGLLARDALTNLNFVEVTKDIIVIPDGYEWLSKHDVLNKLMLRLGDLESDSFEKLLIPGYLSLLGCAARFHPEQLSISGQDKPTILRMLAEASVNSDPTISLTAIESVSYIASSIGGRSALTDLLTPGGALMPALIKLGRFLEDSPPLFCARALDSMAELVVHIDTENDGPDLDQAVNTLNWVAVIGGMVESHCATESLSHPATKVLKRLLSLASNPYTDLRFAALKALASIASQPWGVRLMSNQPGCMEYMLNRRSEVGMMEATQLMQVKYHIIQNILTTLERYKHCTDQRFSLPRNSELIIRLKTYVKEGIWGIQSSQATVAMEPG